MYERSEGILTSSSDPADISFFLSGYDAIKLLEFIHNCVSCEAEKEFKALFPALQELFPFDFATVVLGHLDDNNGIVTAHHVNISFSEEWFHEYLSRGYLQKDTNVRENFTSYKLQNWTNVTEKLRQPEEIISLCMDFDMRQGYTCGSRPLSPAKNGSMFCFSGPSMECNRRSEAILKLVIPHLHQALSHLFNKKQPTSNSVVISVREKEVLNWLQQGKTSWDVSVILGISERTVNYHVYNIMQKLGVTNRIQAIAIAAHTGLIDLC
jgi:DNA-binding CsgD family transcriptional regulator